MISLLETSITVKNPYSDYFKSPKMPRTFTFPDNPQVFSLLDPRRRSGIRRLGFDRELLHRWLQRSLVTGEVGGHRVVKQQQLLVHHFHLEKCKSSRWAYSNKYNTSQWVLSSTRTIFLYKHRTRKNVETLICCYHKRFQPWLQSKLLWLLLYD